MTVPGIYGIISSSKPPRNNSLHHLLTEENQENCNVDCETFSNAILCKSSLNKFTDDKIFQKSGGELVSIDGVILNLRSLLNEEGTADLRELVLKLRNEQKSRFPLELRGSFIGFIYSEGENDLLLFVDHVGSRPLFYFHARGEVLIFGSNLYVVARTMRQMGYETRLDESGAYSLLMYGLMLGELTLVSGVKRLRAGSTLRFRDGEISTDQYYKLSDQPVVEGSRNEILGELVKRFRKAVLAEYEKDQEYGYRHLATLSGGLDSRSNVAFAKRLGFDNLTCLTFSQANYLDQKIARRICRDNGFEHKFFSLNSGDHLLRYADRVIGLNGGLVVFAGPCNFYHALTTLQLGPFGLLHTGIMGGETLGEMLPQSLQSMAIGSIAGTLSNRISDLRNKELHKYKSEDLFKLEIAFNQHTLTMHLAGHFIDTVSAHQYRDLMDYSIRIPTEYRMNKRIYAEMFSVYLPEFAKYTWEHYRVPPRYPLHLLKGYDQLVTIFKSGISKFSPQYSMFPSDYWYRENSRLREGFQKIFRSDIKSLQNADSLRNDCEKMFEQGNFSEKAAVITLLRAMKILGLN